MPLSERAKLQKAGYEKQLQVHGAAKYEQAALARKDPRQGERKPGAYRVICPVHRGVYLTTNEYLAQMMDADALWTCPVCQTPARFDDSNFDEWTEKEAAALDEAHACHPSDLVDRVIEAAQEERYGRPEDID